MARHFHSISVVLVLMAACLVTFSDAFLTEDDKEELLSAHNFFRSRVRPVATNMAKLVSGLGQPHCVFHHGKDVDKEIGVLT